MTRRDPGAELLAMLPAVLRGELPQQPELNQRQWNQLLTLVRQQNLLPLVFEQLRHLPAAEQYPELFALYRQMTIEQVARQIVREADFSLLYRELRRRGLHPLLIKGPLLGELYPLPRHRITTDLDLLLPPQERERCHQVLLEWGLHTDMPETQQDGAEEISYYNEYLYLELHLRLFDDEELNRLFDGVTERAVEHGGVWSMPPQEHMLYLLLHACKHFIYSGVGLRQAADAGLWARAYARDIDWPRLWEQCRQAHAEGFARALLQIARDRLGIAVPALPPVQVDTEPLLRDMLEGGVFGATSLTRLHSATVTVNAVRADRQGRRQSMWRSLFPRRAYLRGRYPWLDRCPLLLPAAWLLRLGSYARELMGSSGNNHPADSVRLARERLGLLRQYGIIE